MAIGVIVSALEAFAASDVRGTLWVLYYAVMGAAWIGVGALLFALMGIHPRDDVAERRNSAAALAIVGAIVGLSAAFAGANFGDGPGVSVVAISALLSMGTLLALWVAISLFSNAIEAITVERDLPRALRVALLLAACGVVLGRAVAGDWVDLGGTFADFAEVAWPVLPLTGSEILVAKIMRPLAGVPQVPLPMFFRGILPGLVFMGLAVGYVILIGWW